IGSLRELRDYLLRSLEPGRLLPLQPRRSSGLEAGPEPALAGGPVCMGRLRETEKTILARGLAVVLGNDDSGHRTGAGKLAIDGRPLYLLAADRVGNCLRVCRSIVLRRGPAGIHRRPPCRNRLVDLDRGRFLPDRLLAK